jgi:hypothetical protein
MSDLPTSLTEDGPLVFMSEIKRDLSMTDRGVRKWQALAVPISVNPAPRKLAPPSLDKV